MFAVAAQPCFTQLAWSKRHNASNRSMAFGGSCVVTSTAPASNGALPAHPRMASSQADVARLHEPAHAARRAARASARALPPPPLPHLRIGSDRPQARLDLRPPADGGRGELAGAPWDVALGRAARVGPRRPGPAHR